MVIGAKHDRRYMINKMLLTISYDTDTTPSLDDYVKTFEYVLIDQLGKEEKDEK